MRISTLLLTTAVLAGLTVPAFAQPPMPTPEERAAQFKAADKNGDGKLDLAEFKAQMMARMAARGGDAPAIPDEMIKQRFDNRDANKDGGIDATENAAPGGGRRGG